MNEVLLLAGIVIMICILLGRFAESLPVPSLLIFIGLGMFFGVNGPIGIQFDDYSVSESICTACLIFIMLPGICQWPKPPQRCVAPLTDARSMIPSHRQ